MSILRSRVAKLLARAEALAEAKRRKALGDVPEWWPAASERFWVAVERLAGVLAAPQDVDPEELRDLWVRVIRDLFSRVRFHGALYRSLPESALRVPEVLGDFLSLAPDNLHVAVLREMARERTENNGVASWIWWLADGRLQLPANLSPAVMEQLLRHYLADEIDRGECFSACVACRLAWPLRRRELTKLADGCRVGDPTPVPHEFYSACPHCGGGKWTWLTHLN